LVISYEAARAVVPRVEASAGARAGPGKEASAAALVEAVTADRTERHESLTLCDPDKTWKMAEQAGQISPRNSQDRGAGL
jgi:hypothetical protein